MLCYTSLVANKLRRYYGAGYLHFITTSCYRRLALLEKPQHRDLLLEVLERVRWRYHFVVVGYVIMPEHMHLLLSEPERGDPSKVMQAIKQGFARRLLRKQSAADDPPTNDRRRGGLWDTAFDREPHFVDLWSEGNWKHGSRGLHAGEALNAVKTLLRKLSDLRRAAGVSSSHNHRGG